MCDKQYAAGRPLGLPEANLASSTGEKSESAKEILTHRAKGLQGHARNRIDDASESLAAASDLLALAEALPVEMTPAAERAMQRLIARL